MTTARGHLAFELEPCFWALLKVRQQLHQDLTSCLIHKATGGGFRPDDC